MRLHTLLLPAARFEVARRQPMLPHLRGNERFRPAMVFRHPATNRPERVMTSRPATEHLIERTLARLASEPATVADVESGSGAIAIALRAPNAEVWAADVSDAAVELTRANVARYRLGHLEATRSDLGELLADLGRRALAA